MPWFSKGIVELRIEFVRRALREDASLSELCREYGISRPTGYLWLKRFKETGSVLSLVDRNHRPSHCPFQTSKSVEERVILLRKRYGWGATKLQWLLLHKEGISVPRSTIHRIISRHGLLVDEDCYKPALKRFERSKPNELWQVDLKGCMGRGTARCEPLTMLDDYSRFVVGLFPTRTSKLEPIQDAFQKAFEKYGIPEALLMDHGVPWWGAANTLGLTRLSVWLMKQDIELKFSGYNHPQTQGKVERFHRTLAQAVRHKGTPIRFEQWKPLLKTIRKEYNEIRPHEALNMEVPASRYCASGKAFTPVPSEPQYSSESIVAKVDTLGRFSHRGFRLFASEALANEFVRIIELENSGLVYYRKTPLRVFDLRSGETVPFPNRRSSL
jgi:transposase InsO family protein